MHANPIPKFVYPRELKPGELFFLDLGNSSTVCIRAIDPEKNDQRYILPLNPPAELKIGAGELFQFDQSKVLAFGTDYNVHLPTTPDGWSTNPLPDSVSIIVHNGRVCARGFFKQFLTFPVLVDLSNGQIIDLPKGVSLIHAIKWNITLPTTDETESLVFRAGAQ